MTVLHVGARSWLLYDPAEPYTFGPPEQPLLTLNTVDEAGCQWWCDLPEGWAAPASVTTMDARQFGDGGYAGHTYYEPRTLSFGATETGVCVAPDTLTARRAHRRLIAVASSRAEVLFTAPDADGPASVWLRSTGQPKVGWIDPQAFQFAFTMVAEDPLKFDAAEAATASTTELPATRGGAVYPWRYNLLYGVSGGSQGAMIITNRGEEDAQARYLLSGRPLDGTPVDDTTGPLEPLDFPQVVNATTGAQFTINRQVGPDDVVEVDTRSGTVHLNGVSIFTDFRGSFPLLAPGPNTIRWSHRTGVYLPHPRLSVYAASTWK
jgi:hypothetical protein